MKSDKDTRRKVLKALAVGAPTVWAKPVVDSVVLPLHAATSCLSVIVPSTAIFNPPSPFSSDSDEHFVLDSGGSFTHASGFGTLYVLNGTSLQVDSGVQTIYVDGASSISFSSSVSDLFVEPGSSVDNSGGAILNITETCLEFNF